MGRSARELVFHRLADAITAGQFDGLEKFFTEDFVLHDPNAPETPTGHEGVRHMLRSFSKLGDALALQPVQMIEAEDHVTVRWALSWSHNGAPQQAAILAIYRFEGALIAEDWGISARAPWP